LVATRSLTFKVTEEEGQMSLRYPDGEFRKDLASSETLILPGADNFACQLNSIGINQITVLRGVDRTLLYQVLEENLYNPETKKELLIAAGVSVGAFSGVATLYYLAKMLLGLL